MIFFSSLKGGNHEISLIQASHQISDTVYLAFLHIEYYRALNHSAQIVPRNREEIYVWLIYNLI